MIKHILKITETDDITARMAIRNGKGRPEKKDQVNVCIENLFIIRKCLIIL